MFMLIPISTVLIARLSPYVRSNNIDLLTSFVLRQRYGERWDNIFGTKEQTPPVESSVEWNENLMRLRHEIEGLVEKDRNLLLEYFDRAS